VAIRKSPPDAGRLDRVVAEARRARESREKGYREQALKLYPWVCGRCARQFTHANPAVRSPSPTAITTTTRPTAATGSRCTYCHEAEHRRYLDTTGRDPESPGGRESQATHRPFANLGALLKRKPGEPDT
jgi:hypothetical protein